MTEVQPAARDALLAALRDDPDPAVRCAAAEALGRVEAGGRVGREGAADLDDPLFVVQDDFGNVQVLI